jgi:hypothetical protein
MLHNIQYTIITECGFGNKLKSYVNSSLFATIVDLTLIEGKRTIPKLSKIYRTQMSDNYSRLYFILMSFDFPFVRLFGVR